MARTFGCSASAALDILGAWDLPEGMVLESAERTSTATRTDVRDAKGQIIAGSAKVHGFREELAATFRASDPVISVASYSGEDAAGWCIDEFSISTAKGQKAQLAIRAHAHRKTPDGALQNHQEATWSTVADIPPFPWFGASRFGLGIGVADASLQSGTYTVRFLHADADDLDGNWLCGKTIGAVATATFEAVDDTDWSVPQGWTRTTAGTAERNSAYGRRSLAIEKTLF